MASNKLKLSHDEEQAILSGLANGLGFTRSCEILLLDPEEVSKVIRSNKSFHIRCIESLTIRSKAMLVESNQYLNDKKFKSWKNNNQVMQKLNTDLVLWESHCLKKNVTVETSIKALLKYNDIYDAATSIGMHTTELKEYVNNNNDLYIYCSNNKLI